MHARAVGWIIPGFVAITAAVTLAWQNRTTQELRIEQAAAREEQRELHTVRARHTRLAAEAVAPEELERLRADRVALVRLRGEIEQLKARAAAQPVASTAVAEPAMEPLLRVDQMRNLGRATPRAAGETLVWALQRGDIDTAASLLTFTPEASAKMEQVLASVSPALRADFGTAERLMAFAMAGNTSLAGLRFGEVSEAGANMVMQHLEVQRRSGELMKDRVLLRRDENGWRRLILPVTVDALARFLGASAAFHVEAAQR